MQTRAAHTAILLTLLALAVVVGLVVHATFAHPPLSVEFLAVGQGDAVVIQTSTGIDVLIDGGPNRRVLRQLTAALGPFDRTIDVVIATHHDADHIGGLIPVLRNYDVGVFLHNGRKRETAAATQLARVRAAREVPTRTLRTGDRITLGEGVTLHVLSPRMLADGGGNRASLVLLLRHEHATALFTGDAPRSIERYLTARYPAHIRDLDMLKVGHHGADDSSAPEFLAVAAPAHAVISVGAENPYGHPDEEVLAALAAVGARVHRTTDGSVSFVSDGDTFHIRPRAHESWRAWAERLWRRLANF